MSWADRFRREWREEQARQRAQDDAPEEPAPSPPRPHGLTVYSTAPGRPVLRKERCDCPIGREHSVCESPPK